MTAEQEAKLRAEVPNYDKEYNHYTFDNITNEQAAEFIIELKSAINKDDREVVAKLFNCTKDAPCSWSKKNSHNKSYKVMLTKSKKAFLKYYDLIITDTFKEYINHKRAIESIWAKYISGFTICNGALWFVPKGGASDPEGGVVRVNGTNRDPDLWCKPQP